MVWTVLKERTGPQRVLSRSGIKIIYCVVFCMTVLQMELLKPYISIYILAIMPCYCSAYMIAKYGWESLLIDVKLIKITKLHLPDESINIAMASASMPWQFWRNNLNDSWEIQAAARSSSANKEPEEQMPLVLDIMTILQFWLISSSPSSTNIPSDLKASFRVVLHTRTSSWAGRKKNVASSDK